MILKRIVLTLFSIVFAMMIGGCVKTTAVKNTIEGNMRTYYEMTDGTWMCDDHLYRHRLEIQNQARSTGREGERRGGARTTSFDTSRKSREFLRAGGDSTSHQRERRQKARARHYGIHQAPSRRPKARRRDYAKEHRKFSR